MSGFLTDYPITKAKLAEILDLVRAGENVSSLWMPMSARTDFAIHLQTKGGIAPQLAKKLTFIYLDLTLTQEFVERQLEESLSRYSIKSGVRNKLVDIVHQGQHVVLILDNFSFTNLDWTKYLLSLRHEAPPKSVTFLILAFESEFYATKTSQTDFGLIYYNLVKLPYFTKAEALDWIQTQDKGLTEVEREQVFAFCGGIFGLLANFFRAYRKFKNVDDALHSEQLRNTVQHLWGRFSDRERHILKSISKLNKVPPYTFELNYMREHNLLTADNKIIGNWVKLVAGQEQEIEVELKAGVIVWDGITLNDLFTDKELSVLLTLLQSPALLSREEVSKIMWGGHAVEKYSDWAIDQLFSRLRKKFDSVGLGSDKIETLKGRGFKLTGVKLV